MKTTRSLLVGVMALIAGWAPLSMASDCVEVKGWETLDDPVRLCAYLTDRDQAEACERRGYRLEENLSETEVDMARQFVLLCANEYVIGVQSETDSGSRPRRLAITTAIVEDGDAASGYYDGGLIRLLDRVGVGWSQQPGQTWSE